MLWQVACDFDGTITHQDVTDSLLDRFAPPQWQEIEAEWKAGTIGSRECMTRQVDLLRASPEEIDRHLESVEIDPAFPAFVAFCRARRIPLSVVSDGLDRAIHAVLGRHGLGHLPVLANQLEALPGRRWRLTSPQASESCRTASGTCKCAMMARAGQAGPAPRLSLLIGDGASDFCAAASADLVFAKDRLLRHAEHRGLPHVAFHDFAQAQRLLAALLEAPERFRAKAAAAATAAATPEVTANV
mgnify:CR=1 FL=1